MRSRRRAALLLTALVAAATVTPAGAFQTETFVIEAGRENVATHGPIPGNYPATAAAIPTPSGCGNADNTAPFQGTCDRVPLRIPVPGLDTNQDFIVRITITWEPADEPEETPVNDLDVFLWDNQQIAKQSNPDSTTYTRLATSANSAQPETFRMFNPSLVDYNITVVNRTGPNLSYTLTAEVEIDSFDPAFEDLGPSFGSRANRDDDVVSPADESEEGTEARPRLEAKAAPGRNDRNATGATEAAFLAPVDLGVDGDFGALGGSALEDQLAAPAGPPPSASAVLTRNIESVPVVIVVFWLGMVPLTLVASTIVLLRRRSAARQL